MSSYRGLTWDHPRGKSALIAAAERERAREGVPDIHWDAQPLEGFESNPIAAAAESYDLVVLDHPHLGEAIAAEALLPLDHLISETLLHDWEQASVGPSFRSYRLDGHQWALPLDAATQVAAYRPSLLDAVPATWDEVEKLSRRAPVALSLAGPHALLTFESMCVTFGEPLDTTSPNLVCDEIAGGALDLLRTIGARVPAETREMNPIAMLAHMRDSERIAYCPLVYGYVNYAGHRLRFADAPLAAPGAPVGSTIGGTGLALTRRCRPTPELLGHIEWLMSAEAQLRFIPEHDGQPSRRDAWRDPLVNVRSADFYRSTLDTIESSWVRPRRRGYIPFQDAGSGIVREVITGEVGVGAGIKALRRLARETGLTETTATTTRVAAQQGAC